MNRIFVLIITCIMLTSNSTFTKTFLSPKKTTEKSSTSKKEFATKGLTSEEKANLLSPLWKEGKTPTGKGLAITSKVRAGQPLTPREYRYLESRHGGMIISKPTLVSDTYRKTYNSTTP